jgi:hypothetical protein
VGTATIFDFIESIRKLGHPYHQLLVATCDIQPAVRSARLEQQGKRSLYGQRPDRHGIVTRTSSTVRWHSRLPEARPLELDTV